MSKQTPPSMSLLISGNPVRADDQLGVSPAAQAALDRILASEPESPAERPRAGRRLPTLRVRIGQFVPAVTVLVALVIVVAFLRIGGPARPGSSATNGVVLTFRALPTTHGPETAASIERAVAAISHRANELGTQSVTVRPIGTTAIMVRVPSRREVAAIELALTSASGLEFFDWESSVLTTTGKPVAALLARADPLSMAVSQGTASTPPGSNSAATGGLGLYEAVKLASEQPAARSTASEPSGTDYYLFGGVGTKACTALVAADRTRSAADAHCLLAGPVETSGPSSRALALDLLDVDLAAADRTGAQLLAVKPGTKVLQAMPASFSAPGARRATAARYYVLRDRVAVSGDEITKPRAGTSSTGEADIAFGFTRTGATRFEALTAAVARRGTRLSTGGSIRYQHFAVALNGELLEVPYIDFRSNPTGISATQGAEIAGNFTKTTAQHLADQLRSANLPVSLQLIAVSS